MGKRKNNQPSEQSTEEESKANESKANPKGVIVLGVFIHCEGCADLVCRCLHGFDGVETVEVDSKNNKVTVKGQKANPLKVAERLRKKSGKHVELISPIPPKNKEEKKEPKKPEPKVIEVVLKVFLHCEGCGKDVKQCLHKMKGVQTVEVDMKSSQVKVKGSFEADKLVKYVRKKAGKHASIVVKKEEKKGKEEKKEESKEADNKKNILINYPNYPNQLNYACELFSDENPDACTIM